MALQPVLAIATVVIRLFGKFGKVKDMRSLNIDVIVSC